MRFTRMTAATTAVACSALLVAAGACGADPPDNRPVCGVISDRTSIAQAENGTTEKGLIEAYLPNFLSDNRCGKVNFAVITANGRLPSCDLVPIARPTSTNDYRGGNPNDQATKDAITEAENLAGVIHPKKNLCGGTSGRAGSDVFGALASIARTRPTRIIIFSDMLERKQPPNGVDLYREPISSAGRRARLIKRIGTYGLMPKLDGMSISIYGMGSASGIDTQPSASLEAFWTTFLHDAGARNVQIDGGVS